MAEIFHSYQAKYDWCPGDALGEILAPEIRVVTYAGCFILDDEAIIKLPGENRRKWGELKAKLERKEPPFPPPFKVEVAGDGPWLCEPYAIASDIAELERLLKEATDKLRRRNRQIEDLRQQAAKDLLS